MDTYVVICTFTPGTVMDDVAGAEETVRTLPMSRWRELDIFPIAAAPVTGEGA